MGVAVYIKGVPTAEGDYFPLAGAGEIESIWIPILRKNDLHWVNYVVTAGMTISGEDYFNFLREMEVLIEAMEKVEIDPGVKAETSRCRRLVQLLKDYPPESGVEIYVG